MHQMTDLSQCGCVNKFKIEIGGALEQLEVCQNLGDHLNGNVYVKFEEEEHAAKALQNLMVRILPALSPRSMACVRRRAASMLAAPWRRNTALSAILRTLAADSMRRPSVLVEVTATSCT